MNKILIVDDERTVRIALKTMVNWEQYGFTLIGTAVDGLDALEKVDDYQPDIVITDLRMPKLDGIELIEELIKRNYDGKIIVLSNYGEYEMVRRAMKAGAYDYLMKLTMNEKEFIELLSQAAKSLKGERSKYKEIKQEKYQNNQDKKILKNIFLMKFYQNQLSELEIEKQAKKYNLDLENQHYFLFLISIDYDESMLIKKEMNNQDLLFFAVINIIDELLGQKKNIEIISFEDNTFLVMSPVFNDNLDLDKINELINMIQRSIKMYLSITVSIILGEETYGHKNLRDVYNRCVKGLREKFYYGKNSIINSINLNNKFNREQLKIEFMEAGKSIREFLEVGKLEYALKVIDGIITFAKEEKIAPEYLLGETKLMLVDVDKLLTEWNSNNFMIESYEERFLKIQTIFDYQREIYSFIEDAHLMLKGAKSKMYRQEVSKAIYYLKDHLKDKITLEDVANYVNLNQSYFCRLFKNETGKSIMNYLNDLRMEKAGEIMRKPDSKVKEVALEVGIPDQFYFYRVFKKYYGVNPTQYKNQRN